jgi:DNA-binding IclR family transcriptional regulator
MSEGHLDTIKRMTAVFDYLASQDGDVGVSEIARALGYHKSVAHRLLTALVAEGYLALTEDTRRYRLGSKMLQLGLLTLDRLDVRRLARPRLGRLWTGSGETVGISLRVGDMRIHVDGMESPKEVRLAGQLGLESPLYVGASSKSILAFLPAAEQERILTSAEGAKTANGMPISTNALREELQDIRERGYAVSVGERRAGAFGVSAPIINHLSEVIGSFSVGGPVMRYQADLAAEYGMLALAEARGLSAELGYRGTIGAP